MLAGLVAKGALNAAGYAEPMPPGDPSMRRKDLKRPRLQVDVDTRARQQADRTARKEATVKQAGLDLKRGKVLPKRRLCRKGPLGSGSVKNVKPKRVKKRVCSNELVRSVEEGIVNDSQRETV